MYKGENVPEGKKTVGDWLKTAAPTPSRTCISCQEPWQSAIREVLEELAAGKAGSGVTLAALHRFLTSPEFSDEPYPLTLSALRAHVRHHETDLHIAWLNKMVRVDNDG